MNPPRTIPRLFLFALAILFGILLFAVALAPGARGTEVAPGTTPPGSAPSTVPEAPPETRETEAHLPPVAVVVTPTYTG